MVKCFKVVLFGCFVMISACGEDIERQGLDTSDETVVLNDRVSLKQVPLYLDQTPGQAMIDAEVFSEFELHFEYLISAKPPLGEVSGEPLQATSFAFGRDFAVVGYMMAGSSREGALDVVSLSSEGQADIIASLSFRDVDVADVKIHKDYAYLVGADLGGAVLLVVDLSKPTQPKKLSRLSIPGFFATSLTVDRNRLYVSSGDNHGVIELHLKDPIRPEMRDHVSIRNSLSVGTLRSRVLVLGGWPHTNLMVLHNSQVELDWTLSREPSQAPGRFVVAGNLIFSNAVPGRLQVIKMSPNLKNFQLIEDMAVSGTGNGIDVHEDFIFLAQGEEGLQVFEKDRNSQVDYRGSLQFPNETASSNQVQRGRLKGEDVLFLANGRGGFRVVRYGFSPFKN